VSRCPAAARRSGRSPRLIVLKRNFGLTDPRDVDDVEPARRPASAGLLPPSSWGRLGDVLEMRFKDKGGAVVVGIVVKADDLTITVEDHEEKRWTASRSEVRLRPAGPRSERQYNVRRLGMKREVLIKRARTSVELAQPHREARPGEVSDEFFEVLATPIGSFVWPKNEVRKDWDDLTKKIRAINGDVELLQVPEGQVPVGKFIPSRIEVSNMLALDKRRLLTAEELRMIERWQAFWEAHPDADLGVESRDGEITPRTFSSRQRPGASRDPVGPSDESLAVAG
jgi:hypothetical protein